MIRGHPLLTNLPGPTIGFLCVSLWDSQGTLLLLFATFQARRNDFCTFNCPVTCLVFCFLTEFCYSKLTYTAPTTLLMFSLVDWSLLSDLYFRAVPERAHSSWQELSGVLLLCTSMWGKNYHSWFQQLVTQSLTQLSRSLQNSCTFKTSLSYFDVCLLRVIRSCRTASPSSVFDLPSDHTLHMPSVSVANRP